MAKVQFVVERSCPFVANPSGDPGLKGQCFWVYYPPQSKPEPILCCHGPACGRGRTFHLVTPVGSMVGFCEHMGKVIE